MKLLLKIDKWHPASSNSSVICLPLLFYIPSSYLCVLLDRCCGTVLSIESSLKNKILNKILHLCKMHALRIRVQYSFWTPLTEWYQGAKILFSQPYPWIRPLDKSPIILKKCQSKNSGVIGFVQYISFSHTVLPFPSPPPCHYQALQDPTFLSASLILFLCFISYFSHFCTLLYAVCICLICTACLPLHSLFSFCFKPCGFPGFLSGCWLLCCFSAFLHDSFHFGF